MTKWYSKRRTILKTIGTVGGGGALVSLASTPVAADHVQGEVTFEEDEIRVGEQVLAVGNFGIDGEGCPGRSEVSDYGVSQVEIDWGDGTVKTSDSFDFDVAYHTYDEPGEYTVTLSGCAVCDFDADGTGEERCHTGVDTAEITVLPAEIFPEPILGFGPPEDLNGDGLYEDVNGDGEVDGRDVSALTRIENAYRTGEITLTSDQVAAFDFNGDGAFNKQDVAAFDPGRE